MNNKTEHALIEAVAALMEVLEVEFRGQRAQLLGGHCFSVDAIYVRTSSGSLRLLSEWVLDQCVPGARRKQADVALERMIFSEVKVVGYAGQAVQKVPLLQWCKQQGDAAGLAELPEGSQVLVLWYAQAHGYMRKTKTQGITWWAADLIHTRPRRGVWYSARVLRYDPQHGTLHIQYEYNAPKEMETAVILPPLCFAHFGSAPPRQGSKLQVLPAPRRQDSRLQEQQQEQVPPAPRRQDSRLQEQQQQPQQQQQVPPAPQRLPADGWEALTRRVRQLPAKYQQVLLSHLGRVVRDMEQEQEQEQDAASPLRPLPVLGVKREVGVKRERDG